MDLDTFITIVAVIVCFIACISVLDLAVGIKRMTLLSAISPFRNSKFPLVSIIVPACDEAENIEQAMRTLLDQDYENYEIIAINDRSTDRTGDILDELAGMEDRLRVVHVHDLPQGWMGKIHALHTGSAQAKGEYLLFSDADIMMEKTVLARAVERMEREELGHLTLLFKNSSPGWLLNSLILDAGSGLCQIFRPWLAKKRGSRYFIGIGAFNMVSKKVYSAVGGHQSMKMQPIDDIMLGKIIKEKGLSQECLIGYDMVTVPWYSSVTHMVEGLMKNVLGIINFRLWLVPACLIVLFCFNILPLWGMVFLDGVSQLLFGITVGVKIVAFYGGTRLLNISPWCVFGTLLSPYIMMYIFCKATWMNARNGGIYWRGTFYSLAELRKNRPLIL